MPIQKWSEQIWVAQLGPDPGLSEDIDVLFQQVGGEGPAGVVLDLAGVEHLNSSHLSKLLRLRKKVIEQNCRMKLAGPSDAVWALFLATGLDKVFEFSGDTMTALAELQMAG